MKPRGLHRELFSYHDWASDRVFALARPLDDAQLDQPVAMGFGTLRATLDHLCAAERLWLDRWEKKPWAPLPPLDPAAGVADLAGRFAHCAAEREAMLDKLGESAAEHLVEYRNTAGKAFTNPLGDLILHVTNHGVHHRAQALNMLRRVGVTTSNVDYLFFRLERPTVDLPAETVERLRKRGLAAAETRVEPARLDVATLRRYYEYGDWATQQIFAAAAQLGDMQLDQPFEMGLGTLRKTLLHIRDAEQWWFDNWTRGPESGFPNSPATTALAAAQELFAETAKRRREHMARLHDEDLQQVVSARPGGATVLACRMGESMLQLCCHGTHHRAQASNMLRQLGVTPSALDVVVWLRATAASA